MDKALKQRLAGAVILIALAIIFLPILLDGERQSQPRSSMEIPAQPEVNFPTRRLPIGDHLKPAEAPTDSSEVDSIAEPLDSIETPAERTTIESIRPPQVIPEQDSLPTNGAVITQLEPVDEPVVLVVDASPEELTKTPDPAIPETAGKWKIQIASFAGRSNAEKLVSRLRRTGYQANIDTITRDKLTLHRVIVPAYQDRSEATLAAAAIGKQIEGVNPKVLVPEDADEQAASVDTGKMRWVVQIGSFSKAENANNLVSKLKQADYVAFKELSGSIHKVMVGPFVDKARAQQQRDKINKQLKLNGIVREQP